MAIYVFDSKCNPRIGTWSRVKPYEINYYDLQTYCEALCESCDECPAYMSGCTGDKDTRPWIITADLFHDLEKVFKPIDRFYFNSETGMVDYYALSLLN